MGAEGKSRTDFVEADMSQRYKLECQCGAEHPVETSQAGREITCSCGRTLAIPSMLKMKRLPAWEADETVSERAAVSDTAEPKESVKPAAETVQAVQAPPKKHASNRSKRTGLVIAGVIGAVFFGILLIRSAANPPKPIDVLRIQRFYLDKGKVIRRDSNPIDPSDAYFFVTPSTPSFVIDADTIDNMTQSYAYEYFDYLKTGLDFSDNFYDKYDSLIIRRRLTMVLYGFLTVLSLVTAAIAFLLPGGRKTVGAARGSEWKPNHSNE